MHQLSMDNWFCHRNFFVQRPSPPPNEVVPWFDELVTVPDALVVVTVLEPPITFVEGEPDDMTVVECPPEVLTPPVVVE